MKEKRKAEVRAKKSLKEKEEVEEKVDIPLKEKDEVKQLIEKIQVIVHKLFKEVPEVLLAIVATVEEKVSKISIVFKGI
jgi:hypothetical protein